MIKLRKCQCGQNAYVVKAVESFQGIFVRYWYYVGCSVHECPGWRQNHKYKSKREAINSWGRKPVKRRRISNGK